MGRIQAVESMLAYASYAEQTGREVNLDWVEFSAEEREMMLERARCIRDMLQRPGARGASPKHRLRPALRKSFIVAVAVAIATEAWNA